MGAPTVYEQSRPGRRGLQLPASDVPAAALPEHLVRDDNGLPELSQLDVVRHYQRLAQRNFGVDSGFYPLGSCTMKYNPKVCERAARIPGFTETHPLQPDEQVQGNLELLYSLQTWLAEIGGFDAVALQPAAGAHGELTALLVMRAYLSDRGEAGRWQILIPDTAHGTNPASATMAGLSVLQIPTDRRGNIDLAALRAACDETVVALMLTNPNTLGLFEEQIEEVVEAVHGCGALVYGDGANMNALAGIVRPGDLGIDLMHYNLHKTFSTPHGGGGPGSGPLAAQAELSEYLPGPIAECAPGQGGFVLSHPKRSIGRMSTFNGNFGMMVRAYAYLRMLGAEGLRQSSLHAVLNANYLRAELGARYPIPFRRTCMHEFVCQGQIDGSSVSALDISKRLIDYGFHPPTNYFPLIVSEALMIEPTETESQQTLDAFVAAMTAIAEEAKREPELLHRAPHSTPVGRLDEVRAARQPILREEPNGN